MIPTYLLAGALAAAASPGPGLSIWSVTIGPSIVTIGPFWRCEESRELVMRSGGSFGCARDIVPAKEKP